ncbi:MAG: MerR family transcriptional regulator [Anaerolineae bacterium]|nr:MerR family transcriptional regulator [Anaerolineae bacterium]
MSKRFLRTSDVARAAGVHPNTVRLYEQWGLLPRIPRSAAGYRLFTEDHVEQMRLARTALHGPWLGRAIKESALDLVRQAAAGDLGGALERAYRHLALVQAERAHAEAAVRLLERWAQGAAVDASEERLRIGEAAGRLDVTADVLRNWERNGLVAVPRDPENGYRLYGAIEIGRCRVIRMLSRAGYGMMAILRMLLYLDQGAGRPEGGALRRVLDTPRADERMGLEPQVQGKEDAYYAADHWLSTLTAFEARAQGIIDQLEGMINR